MYEYYCRKALDLEILQISEEFNVYYYYYYNELHFVNLPENRSK